MANNMKADAATAELVHKLDKMVEERLHSNVGTSVDKQDVVSEKLFEVAEYQENDSGELLNARVKGRSIGKAILVIAIVVVLTIATVAVYNFFSGLEI